MVVVFYADTRPAFLGLIPKRYSDQMAWLYSTGVDWIVTGERLVVTGNQVATSRLELLRCLYYAGLLPSVMPRDYVKTCCEK